MQAEPPAAAPPATRPAVRQPASESGVPAAETGQSAVVISKLWLWAGAGILGVVLLALLILRIFPGALPIITPRPTLNAGSAQISDKDGMVMFYVPAGEFTMGSVDADSEADSNEKPQHKVYLGAFWIDRTEVTNAMFGRFVSATSYQTDAEKRGRSWVYNLSTKKWEETNGANWRHPRGPATDLSGLDSHPVVHVSWNDAVAYCRLAGRRLPTEAEWEKAARGMDSRKYPWGSQGVAGNLLNFADRNLDMYYADKNVDDGYRFTAPVGSYPAGASLYGALDMAGNVWEWMVSLWGRNEQTPEFRYPYNPTDGREDISASDTVLRVLRGGSWADAQKGVRATFRDKNTPHEAVDYIGFRCARSP